MESDFNPEQKQDNVHPELLSKREQLALEGQIKAFISGYDVVGEDALDVLPKGKKNIFATSHNTDCDVPLSTLVTGREVPVKLSLHQNLAGIVGLALGKDMLLPIDSKYSEPSDIPGAVEYMGDFNPDNFIPMEEAMEQGYAVVIAAHNPVYGGKTPDHAGLGPGYLAQIAGVEDTVIIPIGVEILSENQVSRGSTMFNVKNLKQTVSNIVNRPKAVVRIGSPMQMEEIDPEKLQYFQNIMSKNSSERTQEETNFRRRFLLELEKANRGILHEVQVLSGKSTEDITQAGSPDAKIDSSVVSE